MKRFLTTFCTSFLLAVLPFIAFTSCSDDDLAVPPIGGGDGSTTFVKFILNGSASGSENAPGTYALGKTEEDTVLEVDILLFSINNSLDNAVPIVGTVKPDGSGGIHVEANIPVKYYGSIVLLANASSILSTVTLTEGMQYTAVMPLLELKLDGKWNTTKGSQGYMSIPMHGETGFVKIDADVTNTFNIGLTRMLNRVDVALTTEAAKNAFELTSVAVYHRNTVGRVLQPKIAGVPNLPSEAGKIKGPLRYTDKEITTEKISSVGEIYLMESHIAVDVKDKGDGLARVDNATCLVVGGKYVPDGNTYYYRIDFALKDNHPTGFPLHFYNLLRNYNYEVNITAVNGPGEDSEEEALDTERSLIDVEVIPWINGGAIDGAIDGQYILRLSQGSFDLPYTPQIETSLNNKLTVTSTHPDGWYIEKITEVVGGIETAIPADGWLSTDLLSPGVPQLSTKTFSLILSENGLLPRIGYIYIKSGSRMQYKLKVTQVEATNYVKQIIWEDYVGPGFTSITIEDDTGFTATSLVNSKGQPVYINNDLDSIVKPIGIAGTTLTKVTTTYKGYILEVPSEKFTYDKSTQIIRITDRTLIGEPVHLVRINMDLTDSYIQVDDVSLDRTSSEWNPWMPIGYGVGAFTGNYDGGSGHGGKGFEIHQLNINMANSSGLGLFGEINNPSSVIKKIHIVSGTIIGNQTVGAICGRNLSATIESCSNGSDIFAKQGSVGGICGQTLGRTGLIKNCTNYGKISGEKDSNFGGICGFSTESTFDGCNNYGTVSVTGAETENVGGILGSTETSDNKIINCNNMKGANISGVKSVGGICGSNAGLIENCTNSGDLIGIKMLNNEFNTSIGGICGYNYGESIIDCKNKGDISAPYESSKNLGGIVGLNKGIVGQNKGIIEKCINSGSVNGGSSLGGIVGNNTDKAAIIRCENSGAITSEQNNIGGICGYNLNSTISFCSNTGEIEGGSHIGGISGSNANAATITGCRNGAKITGIDDIGGICGYSDISGTIIENCENSLGADVSGDTDVGGIVGQNSTGNNTTIVRACINAATITGKDHVGGICGRSLGNLSACYNIGLVEGTTNVGPIWGYRGPNTIDPPPPTLKNCYYGGAATSTGLISGAIKFGAPPAWPTELTVGWEPTGPWSDLGGWNGGVNPTWPSLDQTVITPAPPAPYRRR